MRNLKKVLSLALAMVMLLGMMVVGAGATNFKDDKDIKNQEAAAVVSTIKVLVGDETGNFNPTATLDRASAAVVIAKLDLGVEAAEALKGSGMSVFSDVPATHWAAGAIEYCASQEYILGDGAGKFNPSANVTGVQFGIMLAKVLGYDGTAEELGGANWAIKGAALARKAGLVNGVTASNEPMTRDDMAQMTFNALTAITVEYEGLNINVNGVTMTSKAKARLHSIDKGESVFTYDGQVAGATTPIRLCEDKFPLLQLTRGAEDEFGRTQTVWKWKSVEIAETKAFVTPDATFTAKATEKQVLAALNNTTNPTQDYPFTLYVNGNKTYKTASNNSTMTAKQIADTLTGNGRLVEIYLGRDNKAAISKIVVVDTVLGQVTKVSDSKEEISIKLEKVADEKNVEGAPVLTTKVGYGEFKKGDMVLVQGWYNDTKDDVADGNKLNKYTTVDSVVAAEKITGLARVKNYSAGTITVDGEARKMNYAPVKNYGFTEFQVSTNYDCTLYLDGYNNIIKAIKGEKTNTVTDNLIAVKDHYSALDDGKIVTKVSGVLSNGETVNWVVDNTNANVKGNICSWNNNGDGTYTVSKLDGDANYLTTKDRNYAFTSSGTVRFDSNDAYGKGAAGGYMYADDVKFIFVGNEGVTVLNGRQSQSITSKDYAQAVREIKNDAGTVVRHEIIAVFVEATPDVVNVSDIIFVYRGSSESRQVTDEVVDLPTGGRQTIYGYEAYTADGEPIENFYGQDKNMGHKFYKKDTTTIADYTVYKPTGASTTSMKEHTVLQATVKAQNGLRGDAFVVTRNNIDIKFIAGSAKVVDLCNSWIESVEDLNEAAVENRVVVSVIYNATTSDDTNRAVTVFVESVTKKTAADESVFNKGNGVEETQTLPTVSADETITVGANKTLKVEGDVIGKITASSNDATKKATVEITGNVYPDDNGEPAVEANGNTKITITIPEGEALPAGAVKVTGAGNEIVVNGDVVGLDLIGATGTGNTVTINGSIVADPAAPVAMSRVAAPSALQVPAKVAVTVEGDIERGADVTVTAPANGDVGTKLVVKGKALEAVKFVPASGETLSNEFPAFYAGYKGVWTTTASVTGISPSSWDPSFNMYTFQTSGVTYEAEEKMLIEYFAEGSTTPVFWKVKPGAANLAIWLPMKAIGHMATGCEDSWTYGYIGVETPQTSERYGFNSSYTGQNGYTANTGADVAPSECIANLFQAGEYYTYKLTKIAVDGTKTVEIEGGFTYQDMT